MIDKPNFVLAVPDALLKELLSLWCDLRSVGELDTSLTNHSTRPTFIEVLSNLVCVQHVVYFVDQNDRLEIQIKHRMKNSCYCVPLKMKYFKKWVTSRSIHLSCVSVHFSSSKTNWENYAIKFSKFINAFGASKIEKIKIYNIPATYLPDYDLYTDNNERNINNRILQQMFLIETLQMCCCLQSLTLSSVCLEDTVIISLNIANLSSMTLILTEYNVGLTELSAEYIASNCKNLVYFCIKFDQTGNMPTWGDNSIISILKNNEHLLHLVLLNMDTSVDSVLNYVVLFCSHIKSVKVTGFNLEDLVKSNVLTALMSNCPNLKEFRLEDYLGFFSIQYYNNTVYDCPIVPVGKGLFYKNLYFCGTDDILNALVTIIGFACVTLDSYNVGSVRSLVTKNPNLETLMLLNDNVLDSESALSVSDLEFILQKCPLLRIAEGPQGTIPIPVFERFQNMNLFNSVKN
jgi:hypothetical protein